MLSGHDLIDDINACEPESGKLALWWLGQHSFVVKVGRKVIYIDPFLTPMDQRVIPPLLRPEEVTNASIVCGTHDHADHIDRPVWPGIAAASPGAMFVIPSFFESTLPDELEIPASRFVGLDDGESIELDGVKLSAVAAAHEFLDRDPATGRHPYLGYIIEAGGVTIYHAGDTCIYEGLVTKLRRWKFDVMFLPINGRDAARLAAGCIGNMTYQEAVDLAGTLQPRLVIPAHYEMFKTNLGDWRGFVEYARVKYPSLRTHICQHGERLIV